MVIFASYLSIFDTLVADQGSGLIIPMHMPACSTHNGVGAGKGPKVLKQAGHRPPVQA